MKKLMISAAIVMLLSTTLFLFGTSHGMTIITGLVPPMECYDTAGRKVVFGLVKPEMLWESGVAVAEATIDPFGFPHVFVDKENFQSAPRQVQRFFQAHECAHHQLGHLNHFLTSMGAGGIGQFNLQNNEKDADCKGIKTLVTEYNYNWQDIVLITNTILDKKFMSRFYIKNGIIQVKFVPSVAQAHNRTIEQRAEDIKLVILSWLLEHPFNKNIVDNSTTPII